MTREQKLTQLTEKICELVPDIKELKFGCKVHYYNHECLCLYKVNEEFARVFVRKNLIHATIDNIEIIGRDIRLADVLLAIKLTEKKGEYLIFSSGRFGFWKDSVSDPDCHDLKWDLTQNALHLQDEETIDFIYSIICE